MARYQVYDHFLNQYLDPERNWAEDIEDGWYIHIEDGAGLTGEKIFVATSPELPEGLPKCDVRVKFQNGYTNCEVYYGDLGKEGLLVGSAGGAAGGGSLGAAMKKAVLGLILGGVGAGLFGFLIGKAKRLWKVRYL